MNYEFSFSLLRRKINRKNALEGFLLLIIFILGYIILSQIGLLLQDPRIKDFISHTGIWGVVIFYLLYILTIIIAPLPGFPLLIIAFAVFGVYQTILLNYFLTLLGGVINFFIARIWGRDIVQSLVGKNGMKKID